MRALRWICLPAISMMFACSDASPAFPDAGDVVVDAGDVVLDAGDVVVDAGESEPDAGDVLADAGEVVPDAGENDLDAGEVIPDAECSIDYDCDSPASCVDGTCVCPIDGCLDVDECRNEGLGTSGCAACLSACETEDRIRRERESLERIAAAFRAFREDTGGWPYFDSDWSTNDPADAVSGGLDPFPFLTSDTALFSQGRYSPCSDDEPIARCWKGPYLTPGANLASEPWLDAWGRVHIYAIVPPEPLAGSTTCAPDGAVIIWSRGPDGIDGTGCSDGGCSWDKCASVRGEPSKPGADDVIVLVGPSPAIDPVTSK